MRPKFAVHKLNEEGQQRAQMISESFDSLVSTLNGICMDCREYSIAKTKLEEACFFAKKAMAINLANQDNI